MLRPVTAVLGALIGLGAVASVLALVLPTFVAQARQFVMSLPGVVDRVQELLGVDAGPAGFEIQDALQRVLDDPERLIAPLLAVGTTVLGVVVLALLVVLTTI